MDVGNLISSWQFYLSHIYMLLKFVWFSPVNLAHVKFFLRTERKIRMIEENFFNNCILVTVFHSMGNYLH